MWQRIPSLVLFGTLALVSRQAAVAAFDAPPTRADTPGLVELVVTDVAVLDVDAGRLLPSRTLVVRGTRLDRIDLSSAEAPASKVRIRGRGKVVIPGLMIDGVPAGTLRPEDAQALLAWGVTGVGDVGTAAPRLATWRADLDNGRIYAPRVWRGCDTTRPAPRTSPAPDSVHAEMARLVASGVSAADAIRRYTRDAARTLCSTGSGAIRVGESADFVVLDGNPLDDIRHTRDIDAVIFRGEAFTQAHVTQLRRGTLPPPTPPRR